MIGDERKSLASGTSSLRPLNRDDWRLAQGNGEEQLDLFPEQDDGLADSMALTRKMSRFFKMKPSMSNARAQNMSRKQDLQDEQANLKNARCHGPATESNTGTTKLAP